MQMTLEARDTKHFVLIQHKDESISWNVSIFDYSNFRGHFDGKYDIFKYNNLFWQKMKPERQDIVFDIFKKLRIALENYTERTSLTLELFPLIHDLFEFHRLEEIEHWIMFFTDIQFPPELQQEYIPSNERTGTRDQTYLRDDYIKLISLTFALRLMIPIWGEFIAKTKRDTGTQFKEYYGFQLLSQSHLSESVAMEKLKTYVFRSIPDERSSGSILGGLSSEDFPIWILSLVVIRKLCSSDISGKEQNSSLIPYIYNHVRERVHRSDNNFVGMVREKNTGKESGENGTNDKLSKLEGYKIRQETSPGDIVFLEHAMSDIRRVTKQICPDLDPSVLENSLKTSMQLQGVRIHEPQLTLIQWVFKPIISTRAVLMLSKATVVSAAAATQAVLMHMGHLELGALATAYAPDDEESYVGGVDSRARITKELNEELSKLYPYTRRSTSKAKTAKNTNQAILAIDDMTDKLSDKNWILTVDQKLLPYLTGSETSRRFALPHQIKILLAELVIALAKRPRNY